MFMVMADLCIRVFFVLKIQMIYLEVVGSKNSTTDLSCIALGGSMILFLFVLLKLETPKIV